MKKQQAGCRVSTKEQKTESQLRAAPRGEAKGLARAGLHGHDLRRPLSVPRLRRAKSAWGAAAVDADLGFGVGTLEAAEFLLSRGAAVDERDNRGMTALMMAAGAGHAETVRFLLSSGAARQLRDRSATLMQNSFRAYRWIRRGEDADFCCVG